MKLLGLFLSCSIFNAVIAQKQFIDAIYVSEKRIVYQVDPSFHATYLRENLYVEYDDENLDLTTLNYSIITMPLIMNTIAMIWISGEDYYIDNMDSELYRTLEIVRTVFKRFYPNTAFNGNLIPRVLINNKETLPAESTSGIALPFSHGLDSLCTSLRLREKPQLLITARGLPDTPLALWDTNWIFTKNTIERFAKRHGHTNTFIQTNFHDFFNWKQLCTFSKEIYNWRICCVEGLGWMGLAAPILIAKGYTSFILPANSDWWTIHPGADCPLINDTIRFANVVTASDGFELSRMEKNNLIAQICNEEWLEKPYFMICEKMLHKRKNCCKCQKCAASILAFLLIDEDPTEYGFTIPIPKFLAFFKTEFLTKNTFEDYPANWYKYCQELARQRMPFLSADLQDFFAWYCTIDFDALTLPCESIKIDYSQFLDIYPNIPQIALQRRKIKI